MAFRFLARSIVIILVLSHTHLPLLAQTTTGLGTSPVTLAFTGSVNLSAPFGGPTSGTFLGSVTWDSAASPFFSNSLEARYRFQGATFSIDGIDYSSKIQTNNSEVRVWNNAGGNDEFEVTFQFFPTLNIGAGAAIGFFTGSVSAPMFTSTALPVDLSFLNTAIFTPCGSGSSCSYSYFQNASAPMPNAFGTFTAVSQGASPPSCQANVTSWKQYTPWGSKDYDHSYVTSGIYATKNSTPVSISGHMELQNGTSTFPITLTPGTNNLNGLATSFAAVPGVNAHIDFSQILGGYYLSVYNTRCQTQSCFPRPTNELHLCEQSCGSGADLLKAKTMGAYGCALTSLAMSLNAVDVSNLQERNGPVAFNPLALNEFMSNTVDLTSLGGAFDSQGNVDWYNTPVFVGQNLGLGNKKFQFDGSADLDTALCTDHLPVIVGVNSGQHYVVVTGKQGTATDGSQYSISDPGYNKQTLADYQNSYKVIGVVRDPADMSQFNIDVGDNADILITDPSGLRTGFDVSADQIIRQIPSSAYVRTQVLDDETGTTSTGLTHALQILKPSQGTYTLTVNGVDNGTYTAVLHSYSQNGNGQVSVLSGISKPDTPSTYQFQYNPTSGTVPQITLASSSQGTVPSSQISTTASGLAYSRVSKTFNGTVTIKNIGSTSINAPLQIVMMSLTPGVTLVNATGNFVGNPYITSPLSGSLAPGQSATVSVQFSNPSNAMINFTPAIYSGSLN